MAEVLFYHLQGQSPDQVLPPLLEKSLERGWRAVVQGGSDERVDALDSLLWTFRDDSFLPHGTSRDPQVTMQPVVLTTADDNPNAAQVRFLIDNVPLPADLDAYQRVVLIFDGDDDEAVAAARGHWTAARARGVEATYWQADENGRWQRKA